MKRGMVRMVALIIAAGMLMVLSGVGALMQNSFEDTLRDSGMVDSGVPEQAPDEMPPPTEPGLPAQPEPPPTQTPPEETPPAREDAMPAAAQVQTGPFAVLDSGRYPTLPEAVNAAKDGGVIVIDAGSYSFTGDLTIAKNLTLQPAAGAAVTLDFSSHCLTAQGKTVQLHQMTLLRAPGSWWLRAQGGGVVNASHNYWGVDTPTFLGLSAIVGEGVQTYPYYANAARTMLRELPTGKLLQNMVDTMVQQIWARIQNYTGETPVTEWEAAAAALGTLPKANLVRAPDYSRTVKKLNSISRQIVTVTTDAVAQGMGLLAGEVETVGARLCVPQTQTHTVVLQLAGLSAPTHAMPSGISGKYARAIDIKLLVDGSPVTSPRVPVTITMPLPVGCNPNDAVILHYNATGALEYLEPSVSAVGGKRRITFTTTSFSEFVVATRIRTSSGGSDGWGTRHNADEDDAYNYWLTIRDRIETAPEEGYVFADAERFKARTIPAIVLEKLFGRDVLLEIGLARENSILIYGKTMYPVPGDQVFYRLSELAELYDEDGYPVGWFQPEPLAPPPTSYPQWNQVQSVASAAPPPVSSAPPVEPSSAPENISSEPEQPEPAPIQPAVTEPPRQRAPVPLWIPVIIAFGSVTIIGGVVILATAKRKKPPNLHPPTN